ncbi:MAG: hypothetical protein V1782_09415 [Pseudomonadota bacterium]
MKKHLVVLVSLLSLITGCEQKIGKQPQNALHETVETYNGLLADGYRRMDMNHLTHAATGERAAKAYYHMAALGEGRVKMDSALRNLEFLATKELAPGKAEVTTKERWEYKYIDIKNGKASPRLSVNYTARYRLLKEKEKWLVAEITILYTDRPSDADELAFFKRPAHVPQGSTPEGDLEPIAHPEKK